MYGFNYISINKVKDLLQIISQHEYIKIESLCIINHSIRQRGLMVECSFPQLHLKLGTRKLEALMWPNVEDMDWISYSITPPLALKKTVIESLGGNKETWILTYHIMGASNRRNHILEHVWKAFYDSPLNDENPTTVRLSTQHNHAYLYSPPHLNLASRCAVSGFYLLLF